MSSQNSHISESDNEYKLDAKGRKHFGPNKPKSKDRKCKTRQGRKKKLLSKCGSYDSGDESSASSGLSGGSKSSVSHKDRKEKPWTSNVDDDINAVSKFEIFNIWDWKRVLASAARAAPVAGIGFLAAAFSLFGGHKVAGAIAISSLSAVAAGRYINDQMTEPILIDSLLLGDNTGMIVTHVDNSAEPVVEPSDDDLSMWGIAPHSLDKLTALVDVRNANYSTVPIVRKRLRLQKWRCEPSDGEAFELLVSEDVVSDLITRYKSSDDLKRNGHQVASRSVSLNLHVSSLPRIIDGSFTLAYLWRLALEQREHKRMGKWLN